jgi:hypothetical protein
LGKNLETGKNVYWDISDNQASLLRGLFKPYRLLRMVQGFKSGRTSAKNGPKTGRPSTSTDDHHVEKVRAVIRENRCLNVSEASEEVGISKCS